MKLLRQLKRERFAEELRFHNLSAEVASMRARVAFLRETLRNLLDVRE